MKVVQCPGNIWPLSSWCLHNPSFIPELDSFQISLCCKLHSNAAKGRNSRGKLAAGQTDEIAIDVKTDSLGATTADLGPSDRYALQAASQSQKYAGTVLLICLACASPG